jgi:GDSL-like Lipase/Acylhydrolase family
VPRESLSAPSVLRYRAVVSRLAFAFGLAIAVVAFAAQVEAAAPGVRTGVPVVVAAPVAGPPRSLAAAGDSFNTGFAARPKSGDNPDLSWSTGDSGDVGSIYDRLLALSPGLRDHRALVAVDGSKISDLPRQFRRAAAFHAQLVTVQSGGNDVCAARDASRLTPPGSFRRSVEAAFEVARERMPDARIFVTSLTDEARWNDRSATIPGNGSKLSDGTLCDPNLDARGVPSPPRRREIQAAEQRYNGILRDVCSRDAHCRYDGGAFFRLEYDREDVAPTNAFHPSERGLRRMASTAWRAGFDFRDSIAPRVSASTRRVGATLRVALQATDAAGVAGFECRFGSETYSACSRLLVLPHRARVTYRAVDRNGNISAAYRIVAP